MKFKIIILTSLMLGCKNQFLKNLNKGINEDRAFAALERGDFEIFKAYFEKLENVNVNDNLKNNFLHIAVKLNAKQFYDYLLENGVSASSLNSKGNLPEDLVRSTNENDNKILKEKLKKSRECQLIIDAIKKQEKDVLAYLLKDKNICEIKDPKGDLIIYKACRFLKIDTINLLIDLDKKYSHIPLIRDFNNNTILHVLAVQGNVLVTERILDLKEDISKIKNLDNKTFLDLAYDNLNFKLIKKVLKKIQEFNVILDDNFIENLFKNSDSKIINILFNNDLENLLLKNIKKDFNNKGYIEKFNYACDKRYWSILNYLSSDASNFKVENYSDILIRATLEGDLELLKNLEKVNAKFKKIKLDNGNKLIHKSLNNLEVLKFMINIFSPEEKNGDGDSIFHLLIYKENLSKDVLSYLFNLKCDYENLKNKDEKTFLEMAIEKKRKDLIKLFLKINHKNLSSFYLSKMSQFCIEKRRKKISKIIIEYLEDDSDEESSFSDN